jgi:uncharacterized protein YyaL (SSP411 family)
MKQNFVGLITYINSRIFDSYLAALAVAVPLWFTLGCQAQPPSNSFAHKADKAYNAIYRTFYDSTTRLFRETNSEKANERKHSWLWPLCALIQAANEMERIQPGKQLMPPVMDAIDAYRSNKPPVPGYDSYVVKEGGGDRFYDDNQWIGIAYMDAWQRTRDKKFLSLAEEIYRFMMSGYDTISGGGLYWKEGDPSTKNTCSNGPGIILALRLYQATNQQSYLDTALLLYQWTNQYLLSEEGVYYDALKLPSREIDKRAYSYNTGTMLQSNVLLYQITGEKPYLQEAQRLAKASLKRFFKDGRFPDNYWFNAVLLRGYEELYTVDGDKTYIDAFIQDAVNIWQSETNADHLAGKRRVKRLLDQAGYVEILARLARLAN